MRRRVRERERERERQSVAIGKLSSKRASADSAVLLEFFHVGFSFYFVCSFQYFRGNYAQSGSFKILTTHWAAH